MLQMNPSQSTQHRIQFGHRPAASAQAPQFEGERRDVFESRPFNWLETLVNKLKKENLPMFQRVRQIVFDMWEGMGQWLAKTFDLNIPGQPSRITSADAYTAEAGQVLSQDAKDRSVYHIAFRRRPKWMETMNIPQEESRLIFHGLQQVMREYLQNPLTWREVERDVEFLNTVRGGKPLKLNKEIWERALRENNGILPIKIEAPKDGAVIFPGEPVMQVTAKEGYGQLALYFESKLLQVWAASERATLMRHILEYNKNLVRQCSDGTLSEEQVTALAQTRLADFSDRSSMNGTESARLGLASLTSHPVNSTLSALQLGYDESGGKQVGVASMSSLSHAIVESWPEEKLAYLALYDLTKGSRGSYVADCYDYHTAVQKHMIPLAREAQQTGTTVCVRPDSGDPFEAILEVLKQAEREDERARLAGENLPPLVETINTVGHGPLKVLKNIWVVQADGISPPKMMELDKRLIEAGYAPPYTVSYGIGGGLHDLISRGSMSVAMKLAEVGEGDKARATMKLAEGKASIPGAVKVTREPGEPTVRTLDEPGENTMVEWYNGIDGPGIVYEEPFDAVQQRVREEFTTHAIPDKIFSDGINAKTEVLREKHLG